MLTAKQARKQAWEYHFDNNSNFNKLVGAMLRLVEEEKAEGKFEVRFTGKDVELEFDDGISDQQAKLQMYSTVAKAKMYLRSLGYTVKPKSHEKLPIEIYW